MEFGQQPSARSLLLGAFRSWLAGKPAEEAPGLTVEVLRPGDDLGDRPAKVTHPAHDLEFVGDVCEGVSRISAQRQAGSGAFDEPVLVRTAPEVRALRCPSAGAQIPAGGVQPGPSPPSPPPAPNSRGGPGEAGRPAPLPLCTLAVPIVGAALLSLPLGDTAPPNPLNDALAAPDSTPREQTSASRR